MYVCNYKSHNYYISLAFLLFVLYLVYSGVLWGAYFNLQHVDWLDQEGKQFLRTHMDIGDCYEAAMSCLQQWQEFHSDVNVRRYGCMIKYLWCMK